MLKPYQKAELTFDVIQEIGAEGKNSQTYIVQDHQLNARIVSKKILKSKISSPTQFFSESQALYASAHSNVVQVHYACYDADHIYIAMPYYARGSLKALITGRFMTVREIVAASCQVLSGLHNIHSKRLVHFDVKPDNILISDRGEALVSDFGQAKQMNFAGIAAQDRHYTPMIPPEAMVGDQFSHSFDIYQFGLTLYRLCNGDEEFYKQLAKYGPRNAFDRDAFRFDVRNGRFPDRKTFPLHIPARLKTVVKRCLSVDPGDRYASALDVANALADVDGNSLDWRLVSKPDSRVWTKNESGTTYELALKTDGSSEFHKQAPGGQRRRVLAGCKDVLSEKEAQKLLGGY